MIDQTIKEILVSRGITETIYLGFLAAQPDTAIVITPTAGLPPDGKHNYNTPGIQVRTRAADYQTAETLAFHVFDILQSLGNTTISGVYITDIQAQQDPYSLGRDEVNRHSFVQNFLIEYYNELGHRI